VRAVGTTDSGAVLVERPEARAVKIYSLAGTIPLLQVMMMKTYHCTHCHAMRLSIQYKQPCVQYRSSVIP
jgi:hypothetical protein